MLPASSAPDGAFAGHHVVAKDVHLWAASTAVKLLVGGMNAFAMAGNVRFARDP